MSEPACMGGWCTRRDQCGAHHSHDRTQPAERLCDRGHEQPRPLLDRRFAAWLAGADEATLRRWAAGLKEEA